MSGLLLAFFSSFITTLLIIRFKHLHSHLSADSDLTGPQKFHTKIVPRIGGIAIAIGLFFAILLRLKNVPNPSIEVLLLICAIPTFSIGLIEDLTKKISVRQRLFFTAISATLFVYLLQAQIVRLDIPGIDFMLTIPLVGAILTIFAMTGLANAYNIIDGFNGLASMVGIITLLGLAYIGFLFNDPTIIYLSLVMVGAILGFFIWNYPRGLIFLGDGGAYLIGFWIAALSILLVYRHSEISPWFALLINGYPILETLFTIYRRRIHQGKSPGQPDGIHFHTLIYRRILMNNHQDKNLFSANSRTAPRHQAEFDWASSPHTSFWTLEGLENFIGFLKNLYISETRSLLNRKYQWHQDNNIPGGICDMTALFLWQKSKGDVFNLATAHHAGLPLFDNNLNEDGNMTAHEFLMVRNVRLKKITHEGNQYWAHLQKGRGQIPVVALHFQGRAKSCMATFERVRNITYWSYVPYSFLQYVQKRKNSLQRKVKKLFAK